MDRLSGGRSQRLRLAIALIGDPELLVLDEPTAAMDVEARRDFWNEMRGFTDRGRTLLFSTHYLEEADLSGPRLALDRQVGWLRQLRLTPLSPSRVLAVRLITAMILGLPAICLTFITAAIVKDVGLPLWEWPVLVLLIAAGCLPFAAMGIVVGSSAARRRRVAPSHAAPSVIGH